MLLYYPITFVLWVWHKVFGFAFGEDNVLAWVLGLIFLTFTIRAILFKPFVSQVRSMKKMQDFAPEIKKIQKRYANDKQRQAQAMQKLQREHGVNPLGGCLPILLQVPVFIGLNHTLRAFPYHQRIGTGNYTFNLTEVNQYVDSSIFDTNLSEAIYNTGLTAAGDQVAYHPQAFPVAIPLVVLASILTHLTARHSVARQNPASATQQTAIMNKLTLYIFPIGLLVFGAFLPIGLLVYFLANNAWTLMQQRIVYTRIDREEEAKKAEKVEKRTNLAPKPGQRPDQKPAQKKRPANAPGTKPAPKPGQKPSQKPGQAKAPGTKPGAKPTGAKDAGKPTKPAGTDGKQAPKSEPGATGNGKDKPKPGASGANGTGTPTRASGSKKKPSRKRR
ncbi:MAG: membrane protein insertase YidC [Actinophytocola sp.]|nr:membrane protein insertase YidC [Actinophytocola sp.]